MVSEKYILRSVPVHLAQIFNIAEKMAECYGFQAKELLQIRLVTEEMTSALHQALVMRAGRIWFESDGVMFTVHISCSTDMFGMSEEQREKLLTLDTGSKKGGFFKPLKDYLNFLLNDKRPQEDFIIYDGYAETQVLCHMTMGMGFAEQPWHMAAIPWYRKGAASLEPHSEEKDIDLEMSLIKGFADEIRVEVRGMELMTSVSKKIPVDFIESFLDV